MGVGGIASGAPQSLISLTVYGEEAANAADDNLLGQPYLIFDSAGMVKNTAFDFKGNSLVSERKLAVTYQTSPDWIALDYWSEMVQFDVSKHTARSCESFVTTQIR